MSTELNTFDHLLKHLDEYRKEHTIHPDLVKMSPRTFALLGSYFIQPSEPITVYGMRIVIDSHLDIGEYKFE